MPKAQSAIEYLITYSWAIIIIAITLGAIYSLGLFNPGNFISNQCIFPADFGCLSAFFYSNGTLSINLQQATSIPLNLTAIGCNTGGLTTNMTPFLGANAIYLPIGGNITLSAQCYANGTVFNTQPGALYKGYVVVNYTSIQTGFHHTAIGKIVEKANGGVSTSTIRTSTTTSSSTSTSMTSTSSLTSTSSTSTSTSSSSSTSTSATSTSSTSTSTTTTGSTSTLPYHLYYPPGNANCVISSYLSLTSDLVCGTLTINPGITVVTSGWNIYVNNTLVNYGTIFTNYAGGLVAGGLGGTSGSPIGGNGFSYLGSYGGSGGGGGIGQGSFGGNGGNTIANAGLGSTYVYGIIGSPLANGQPGSTPTPPIITNTLIQSWYTIGFGPYLNGSPGGGGGYDFVYASNGDRGGGNGAGLYIEANQITAGTIITYGSSSTLVSCSNCAGSGGGGSGSVLIAWGSSYTPGTYGLSGAAGYVSAHDGSGGAGGAGQVMTYQWSTPPIVVCPVGGC